MVASLLPSLSSFSLSPRCWSFVKPFSPVSDSYLFLQPSPSLKVPCHFTASIRLSFICLCSVSHGQRNVAKTKHPRREKNQQYLFWMFNLKMIDRFSSQKKWRVIGKRMLWIYLSSMHWLWICHRLKKAYIHQHTLLQIYCVQYFLFLSPILFRF